MMDRRHTNRRQLATAARSSSLRACVTLTFLSLPAVPNRKTRWPPCFPLRIVRRIACPVIPSHAYCVVPKAFRELRIWMTSFVFAFAFRKVPDRNAYGTKVGWQEKSLDEPKKQLNSYLWTMLKKIVAGRLLFKYIYICMKYVLNL